jgi:hypothetical protein
MATVAALPPAHPLHAPAKCPGNADRIEGTVVPGERIELPTYRLQIGCTTAVLTRRRRICHIAQRLLLEALIFLSCEPYANKRVRQAQRQAQGHSYSVLARGLAPIMTCFVSSPVRY